MKKISLTLLSSALLLTGLSLPAWAASTITDVKLLQGTLDEQVLAISFADAATTPRSFALSSPPRIAFDFPSTHNQTGKNQFSLNSNLITGATLVEGQDKSRLVLSLNKPASYTSKLDGNRVLVTLSSVGSSNGSSAANSEPPTEIQTPVVAAAPGAMAPGGMLASLDFRRGNAGGSRIVMDLPSADTPVNIRREGKNVIVEMPGVKIPHSLERRLDVTDFATPATQVEAMNQGKGSRVVIQSEGNWTYSSYQTDRRLVVEIQKQTSAEQDAALLAQGKSPYKGEKLSLNFQNVEVRSLLQVIAEFTGLNVIVSDSVNGSLTLRLKDVPWDQALDLILAQRGLEKRQAGNVIRIAPRAELLAAEKDAAAAQRQKISNEPLITETFQIRYRAVEEFKDALTQLVAVYRDSGALDTNQDATTAAQNAKFTGLVVDPRSNKLIVRDRVSVVEELRKIIQTLDTPLRQVLIEARIVEATDNFQRDLGVKLGVKHVGGDTSIGTFGSAGTISFSPNINLPAGLTGGSIGAVYQRASTIIGLELSAMQAEGQGKIVSSPRILTADRTPATISEGTEIPYTSTTANSTTTQFKQALLSLTVTPQVTPDEDIVLKLNVSKDSVSSSLVVGTEPAIDTKTITTEVRVQNGGTVVIGGVYTQDNSNTENKVPLLGDIPVLGALFRNKSVINNRRELLVFITPRIVESELIAR
ncbi:type IV pilus secretin PilQ [Vogesella sp. LIG4]|uniref:type IV pilus secretin PilQ n=1 Tax=Vogesella sp. LIG4 TaxID=1192162 RepID=UPI0008202184|nr:type IV pilus secretin PilQ [Vogesella sp. LIG4]SCK15179.1 type IV pilus assembly protein PilQ [Vogesella sp. LIG4]